MHILLIPSWYPTPDNPIVGVFFREQALALHRAHHDVGVLVAPWLQSILGLRRVRHLSGLGAQVEIENDAGLPTYRTSQWGWFPGFMPVLHGWLVALEGLRTFRRYCADRGQPDVIHAHSILYGGYLATRAGQEYGVPLVLTEHSSAFLRGPMRFRRARIVRHTLRHVSKRLAVGPQLADAMRCYAPEQEVEVLGNVVDTEYFAPGLADVPETPFIFASVALLTRTKGTDVLLEAFARAFRGENALLRIAGDGGERSALEKLARELGLGAQVEFLGLLSRHHVRALMQQCHAFVSASYVETFGLSLVEAMACGKPVVATRSGGSDYVVNESCGLLVPAGNPEALASAMRQMVRTWDQYHPAEIREQCASRFGAQAIVSRLEEIYQELVSR